MSTLTSSTANITLVGYGATDFSKSLVDKNVVVRTSPDGKHSLQHAQRTTNKGRKRHSVSLRVYSDTAGPGSTPTTVLCTVTLDFDPAATNFAKDTGGALVAFLAASANEEMGLLASGFNLG